MSEFELRKDLLEKLEAAIRGQGFGTAEQSRDQAIEVAALAFALSTLPPVLLPLEEDSP